VIRRIQRSCGTALRFCLGDNADGRNNFENPVCQIIAMNIINPRVRLKYIICNDIGLAAPFLRKIVNQMESGQENAVYLSFIL
jgi:hypothetical protein